MNEDMVSSPTADETTTDTDANKNVRIFAGKLHREQRGHGKAFIEGPPAPPPEAVRRPARVAIMLALAHKIQDAIDRGAVRDQAEAARRLGLTRARVTQLMGMTLLAPDIQGALLDANAIDGVEPHHERSLRSLLRSPTWADQREAWRAIGAAKP